VTKVRVGATPRFRDSATGQWRDAETSYYNVSCWSRLADHVRASLHKGDPVIVKGRFKTSSFEDKNGQLRTSIEITADTVGHDLSRGPANYMRPRPQRVTAEGDPAGDQAQGTPDLDEGPDEMIDEEAIERFGRDLDEADLAARALAEGENEDEDQAAEPPMPPIAGAPPIPAAPF
jgi:single-strand DNA-binding protein